MEILVFLFMNLLVILSSYLITFRVLRVFSLTDSVISWFIIYLSQICLTEISLGVAARLNLANVVTLNALILLLAWFYCRKKPGYSPPSQKTNIKDVILSNKVAFFLFSSLFCFFLVKITVNLLNPPFGWDSLNYHFTFAVEWLKHGNLNTPITVSDDPSPTYYPIIGSLFYLWLILPLKSVFLADLGQVPFFILSFLSVYSISRKFGLKPEFSFYAAGLFCIVPNFFKQLQIAYVDIMVAGLFLACLNFLFLLKGSFTWQNIVIFSLCLGLMIGTKTTALPFSLLLIAPFVVLLLKNKRKVLNVSLFLAFVLALGSFSYLRNFLETGNPLYPLDLKVFGMNIFKGVMDPANYRSHFVLEDYAFTKMLFHEGLGAQVILFVLPSVLLSLPLMLIKRAKNVDPLKVYFVVLPVLIFLIYRYLIPLANIRYIYSLLAVGIIGGFYLYQTLNAGQFTLRLLVLICTFSSIAELAKRQELTVSLIMTFLFFFFGPFILKKPVLKRARMKPLIIFITVFSVFMLASAFNWYKRYEYARYVKMVKYSGFWPDAVKAWEWLNLNTNGDNVAYVGRPVPFPLYGSGFKNNVFYVSVNEIEPAKLHYYPKSSYKWDKDFLSMHKSFEVPGNYRSSADFNAWYKNLEAKDVDFIFCYSLHQTKDISFPIEDKWAFQAPDKFELAFKNNTIHIYKAIK